MKKVRITRGARRLQEPERAPVQGAIYDSAAPLDAYAAIIRNTTVSAGIAFRTWDNNSAAAPETIPIRPVPIE